MVELYIDSSMNMCKGVIKDLSIVNGSQKNNNTKDNTKKDLQKSTKSK